MWDFVITDRTGLELGELRNATSRTLHFALNRTPTLSFTVDATHPFATLLLTDDRVLIRAYENSTGARVLRFHGPCVAHEKVRNTDGGTVAVTAAGVQWRLEHRLLGQYGVTGANLLTDSANPQDRGFLMSLIILALNEGDDVATTVYQAFTNRGDTGIRTGTITASSATYISDWRYKVASDAMNELSATLDGPDWEVAPTEPVADSYGLQIGLLNVTPAIGSTKTTVAFEFGTGHHNVAEWHDVGDASTLANYAVNLPPGFPDNATAEVVTATDSASVDEHGLYETVVAADIATADLRLKLVQENIRVRRDPRRVISFTPIAEDPDVDVTERRVPRLFAEYIVGDAIVFRAVERFPVYDVDSRTIGFVEEKTVDLLLRVYAADIAIDDAGVVQTTLTLQGDQ